MDRLFGELVMWEAKDGEIRGGTVVYLRNEPTGEKPINFLGKQETVVLDGCMRLGVACASEDPLDMGQRIREVPAVACTVVSANWIYFGCNGLFGDLPF